MAKRETILVDKDAYFYLRQESRKQRGGGVITPDQENSIWNRLCKIDGKRQVCGNSFGGGDGTVDGKWWSWSTGHRGGCSTVHADSALDTLHRLESLVTRASLTPQNETVGRAVDMVVYIKAKETDNGTERKIEQIIEVDGYNLDTKKYEYRIVG